MIVLNSFGLLLLVITISNLFSVKTLKIKNNEKYDFDILVPMRNEESNVAELIPNLLNQGGKIFVLDDNSSDMTLSELNKFYKEISILSGKQLPEMWLGKNFACHQLAIHSSEKYLVFIDADVRLESGAISSAISHLEAKEWDFISPYPQQKTSGIIQFLIQPILQWSWLSTIPFWYANRYPNRSMAVANGQFFIVKREAYLASGGHKAIKNEVLDDIELARVLIKSGFKGGPVDGSRIAECHMYRTDTELIGGYGKSLWRAFGGIIGTIIAILLLLATAIPFGIFSIGAFYILISRILVSLKVRSNLLSAIFHPFSMIAISLLIIYSNYLHKMGRITWRERAIE